MHEFAVPWAKVKQELHLPVPAGLISRSGRYSVVFFGADPVTRKAVNDSRVQYFTFNVFFRRQMNKIGSLLTRFTSRGAPQCTLAQDRSQLSLTRRVP